MALPRSKKADGILPSCAEEKVVVYMRIDEILKKKKRTLSFEIFPPREGVPIDIAGTVKALTALKPDFISVTNSAGGSGGSGTLEVAKLILDGYSTESIMHLVCSGATEESIDRQLDQAYKAGVRNILALRGDRVNASDSGFFYAKDLIKRIDKSKFCVGAAAYPEGHIDALSLESDIERLKEKVLTGVSFLTTQLFFDNALFYKFREAIARKGIAVPVLCGIMPVMSKSQISKMIFMCGASLPGEVIRFIHRYEGAPEELIKAGADYAVRQILDLKDNGVDGVHIYTMNKPEIAVSIVGNLKDFRA